mgnify:CR=1 FL=1
MREFILGTVLIGAVGGGVYYMPLDWFSGSAAGYPLTTREAMARLADADLRTGKAPFGTLEVQITKPQSNVLEYTGSGSFAQIKCRVELTPSGETHVTAATSCERAALDGAAASAANDLTDLAFAEYVDSVLDGRPFDDAKVGAQSAGAVLKNLPQMQKDALRMSREMGERQKEWEAEKAADAFHAEEAPADWSGGDSFPEDGGEGF